MFAICKDMVWQVQTWCLWKAKRMAMVIVVKAFHRLYGQENANYCCDRVVIHEFCVNLYRFIIIKVMRRYSLILVLFLIMGLSNGVTANNDIHYYVSPTGSDRANGTKQAPWKTLSNAFGKLQLPLRQSKNTTFYLHLQNGEYEIMQTVQIKGVQNGNTLTVCADEKGKARLVGNKIISNFTKLERQCDKRIPVSARSRILRANLYEFGITDYGVSVGDHQRVDLYCNGKRQPMARYPNDGFISVTEAKGSTKQNDGATDEGIITYSDNHLDDLKDDADAHLYGYWHYNWYESYESIERVDSRKNTIYLKKPYHVYGYKKGARFYVVNSLRELDSPGEYFIDRLKGILYWYPVNDYRIGKDVASISLSNASPMLAIVDCQQVVIDGLTLEGGRGTALRIKNGNGNRIVDCHIAQFGENGINIDGGANHVVQGCLIEQLGMRGIAANGGDRASLTDAHFLIQNNIIRDVSHYRHTYQQSVFFSGCGITVSHNYLTGNHSSAMRFDGNNVVVEYNKIENVVTESDDQGAFDMWGDASYRGVVVRYNHWKNIRGHDVCNKVAGIRLDDIISGVNIYGNVFENCGSNQFGAITIHGGKDNVVENNIFANCPSAVKVFRFEGEYWLNRMAEQKTKDQLFKTVNIKSKAYQQAYPELKKDIMSKDIVNTVKDNLVVNCNVFLPNDYDKLIKKNNHQLFAFMPLKSLMNAENLKKYGLQPVYFEQVGVQKNIFD